MERNIEIKYMEFACEADLSGERRDLLRLAKNHLSHAYAPYSGFRVAAAVLLSNGQVVCGSNQENMAYPSGLCAERVALFAASSSFPGEEINSISLTVETDNSPMDHPVAPCGACRQVMLEYELKQNTPIEVIMQGTSGPVLVFSEVKSLLPLHFYEAVLKSRP